MHELDIFLNSIKTDVTDIVLAEAVSSATTAIFESEEIITNKPEADGNPNAGDNPTSEEPMPDDAAAVPEPPGNDAGTDGNPDNGNPDDAANNAPPEQPAPPPTGNETPGTVNQSPEPAMTADEIVKKFVMSGAVRKAQDEMVQEKDNSLVNFAKKIAYALSNFCKQHQFTTLPPKDGAKLAEALAIHYGKAR